jgi:hypothetical protein
MKENRVLATGNLKATLESLSNWLS